VRATGAILRAIGDHAATAEALALHATGIGARAIVIGASPRGALMQFGQTSLTASLAPRTPIPVLVLAPGEQPPDPPGPADHRGV
jgi:nucleotide-binding universal stress UspA family protein